MQDVPKAKVEDSIALHWQVGAPGARHHEYQEGAAPWPAFDVTGTTGSLGVPQAAAVPVPEKPPQAPPMPHRLPEIDPDEPVPDDPGPLLPDTPQTLPPPPAEPGPVQPINPEVEPV